jgi:hypothetical protein
MNLDEIRQTRTKIVAESKYLPKNINCLWSPQERISFANDEKSYIEGEWNKELRVRPFSFNGELLHVKKVEFSKTKIELHLCKSDFKEFIGTNRIQFKEKFGHTKTVRPLSIGTMIVTSDNKWIIGKRTSSRIHYYEGQYAVVAGYMDPAKDTINLEPDPFFAIQREMMEETGATTQKDIHDEIICLGLIDIEQPYLAFVSTLNISFKQLASGTPKEREFEALQAHDNTKASIENFILKNYTRIAPHSLANILMFYKVCLRT